MRTLFPILAMLLLLTPAPRLCSEPLTRPEIASELGSKQSYSKAEVVELLYQSGVVFDEELTRAKAEAEAIWTAKIKEIMDAVALDEAEYRKQTAAAIAERDTWRTIGVGLCAAGLTSLAYSAFKK